MARLPEPFLIIDSQVIALAFIICIAAVAAGLFQLLPFVVELYLLLGICLLYTSDAADERIV